MAQSLWKIETQEASPVPGVRIQSQKVSLTVPVLKTAVVWNRPLAVLTTDSEGQTVSQPILDITRLSLIGLVLGVFGVFVILSILGLRKTKENES